MDVSFWCLSISVALISRDTKEEYMKQFGVCSESPRFNRGDLTYRKYFYGLFFADDNIYVPSTFIHSFRLISFENRKQMKDSSTFIIWHNKTINLIQKYIAHNQNKVSFNENQRKWEGTLNECCLSNLLQIWF